MMNNFKIDVRQHVVAMRCAGQIGIEMRMNRAFYDFDSGLSVRIDHQ